MHLLRGLQVAVRTFRRIGYSLNRPVTPVLYA